MRHPKDFSHVADKFNMTLKTCTCCKKMLTTKTVKSLGCIKESKMKILYFNCLTCNSTLVLVKRFKELNKEQVLTR